MGHDAATLRQIAAARPDRSTWLSANAGSGKTKVLTDRVARLLLDQVDPQHILCLTYTKAAASEMQNRLFDTLGDWAMLDDDALAARLRALGHDITITPETLDRARRLFASAIETPGGLKIQTIHSFCSTILRRFPLEAGVPPQFTEMEDRAATLLRAEVTEAIAAGPEADTLRTLARHHTGMTLDDLTAEIVKHRAAFARPLTDKALAVLFGQPPDLDEATIAARVFKGGEEALLSDLLAALGQSGANDHRAAEKLARITSMDDVDLPVLEDVFLLKSGDNAFAPKTPDVTSRPFPTGSLRKKHAAMCDPLDAWMRRVAEGRAARLALQAMRRTRALHDFAQVFLAAYEQAKAMRGWLDFDDLILRSRALLTDDKVADWVLYRLDGWIDHILVDEAQDTSPVQWQVIERLAREFTSGRGARPDTTRTIFVVGDMKQSIYSFQGADPDEFDRMKEDFAARLSRTSTPLQDMQMAFSFRSSQTILDLVDATFQDHHASGFAGQEPHKAFKSDMPGRVDLWPPEEKPEHPEDPDWFDPVDIRAPDDPGAVLARRIAAQIRDMIGTALPDETGRKTRPVTPGDFLILVQRRSDLFHDIIRECKALGLPVAGADRLKVGAELAVRDLGALLAFLATPEDDLALATALRSPLFGWDEAALYRLAHGRGRRYLWASLRDAEDAHPQTLAVLRDLRDHVDYLRPYELIERVLTSHDGRRELLARLGTEAEDGIDALLSQAMAYERNAVDSLTGFIVWMQTDDLEIKRQMDSAGDRIRVMTVHGAKGLEAPIVILPDTAARPIRLGAQLAPGEGAVLWRSGAEVATPAQIARDEATRRAQAAERDRLLYVAMTRAEQWLIVAAAGDTGKDGASWYDKLRDGMARVGARPHDFAGGAGLRHEHGSWERLDLDAPRATPGPETALDPLYARPAPDPHGPVAPLEPSDLGGAKTLPGEPGLDEGAAKRRGRQIHRLLEWLPGTAPDAWPETAARLLSAGTDAAEGAELAALLAEAGKVLQDPALAWLFTPGALAEVAISAPLPALGGQRIHGVIDRLLIEAGRVLALDFKTNALVPDRADDCPEGLLRQMGAYAQALARVYPDRRIETALLWTRTGTLMRLPPGLTLPALDRAATDGPAQATARQ